MGGLPMPIPLGPGSVGETCTCESQALIGEQSQVGRNTSWEGLVVRSGLVLGDLGKR